MKYARFEILALVLGTVAIVGSLFLPPTRQTIPTEAVAQFLLILVLASALHWGRNGGFVAALVAIAIYVGIRYPVLTAEGLSPDVVTMIISRALAYTIIGLVGGELAGRVKYLLARSEHDAMIDPVTRVYSARYAGQAIASALGKHCRYGTSCSILNLTISPAVWSDLKSSRMNSLMRRVASHLRNDVRLVDDVAYHENGGFVLILPETGAESAGIVAKRLRAGVVDVAGCGTDEVTARVLTCGADDAELEALADVLAPVTRERDDSVTEQKAARRRSTDRAPENA
ncbi:MAG: GGDEF domain-containing protein [Coriobacteriia bacterium]